MHHEARDTEANAACCGRGFLHISRHFWAHSKKRVLFGETPKKEGFRVHVIRTLSFFRGKSDVFEMRKNKKIHILGSCQHEGPIWWKMLSFSWKTYIFEATSWTKFDHEEQKWLSKLTSDPVRRMLALWPSEMSRTRDPPSPPPSLSLPLPSLSPLSSLLDLLKPYNSLRKTPKSDIDVNFRPN